MNLLLISPNTLNVPYPVYPIGLDYVAGSVAGRHQVRIADLNAVSLDDLDALLAEFVPRVIGLSCRNIDNTEAGNPRYFVDEYRRLVDWLRVRSRAVIVCGGSGFTIMPDKVFAAIGADYGIVGEGERFALLVEALEAGQDPSGLPGVLARNRVPRTPEPWPGERVRRFPSDAGQLDFYLKRGGMLNLQSKRGCCFRCVYCPYPSIEGRQHRPLPPEEVARQAMGLQEAGARYFFITDSAFNSDREHSLAVARAFRSIGLAIPWGGFFAPVRLPGGYFDLMAEAGLTHVEFGTESLSPTMLRAYDKPFTVEDVLAAHAQARKAGIHVAHYFLLGGPGESAATVAESLGRIEALDRAAFFFFIGVRIYPGTRLHELAVREGKIGPQTDLLAPVYYAPDEIGRDEIETMVLARAEGRPNWVVGSGGEKSAELVSRLHARGRTGPLWEHLAR